MWIETAKEFEDVIRQGKAKGHTHCQIMREGYCDLFVSMESVAFKNIATDPMGHSVYAVCTGYPIFSNCNKYAYTPHVTGVTEKENSSFGTSMADFINN